jgi:ParD-like antitoxin of type II bacterial toxin-antitoxin system
MAQPVKLSDELIETARTTADDADRSLAGQIEHWASIGRAVEGMLTSTDVHSLKRSNSAKEESADVLNQRTAIVNALLAALRPATAVTLMGRIAKANPVRYGADPAFPGMLIRVDENGSKTPGRFVGRRFVPLKQIDHSKPELSRA